MKRNVAENLLAQRCVNKIPFLTLFKEQNNANDVELVSTELSFL